MKINKFTYTTFKAKPIYPINLKAVSQAGKEQFVPAFFSEISNLDKDDVELVEKINSSWQTSPGVDNYAPVICKHFMNNKNKEYSNRYYVTELVDKSTSQLEKVKSIIETTNPDFSCKTNFYIDYIQSASQNLDKITPQVKGAGALAIYGAVKLARDNNFDFVKIFSINDDFYDAIGLKSTVEASDIASYYELSIDEYDSFLKQIEEKYR